MMIVLLIILFVSWLIPCGVYQRTENANGQTIVVPGSFEYTSKSYVSILDLPGYMIEGMLSVAPMLVMIIMGGGAMKILIESGSIHWAIDNLHTRIRRIELVIIIMTFIMGVLSLSASITGYVTLTPIFVELSVALGCDAMLGVAIFIVGTAVGFACGAMRPATTGIAQMIAELPTFSGVGYRLIVFVVLMIGSDLVLIRYARRVYDESKVDLSKIKRSKPAGKERTRYILVLAVFIAAIALMMYGSLNWNWSMNEFAELYLIQALVTAVVAGFPALKTIDLFISGVNDTIPLCLITGFASSASIILQNAGVLDTVVHYGEVVVTSASDTLLAPIMFIVNFCINLFIGPGTAQALMVMPIMTPIADLAHLNRQVAVLGFNLGDGLCNYILPTAISLIGPLTLGGLTYVDWMKKMKSLILVWFVLVLVIMAAAPLVWPY